MDADPDLASPMKFSECPGDGLARLDGAFKRNRVFEIEDADVSADCDRLSKPGGFCPRRE